MSKTPNATTPRRVDAGTTTRNVALLSRIAGNSSEARRRLRSAGVEIVVDLPGYEALADDLEQWHALMRDVDVLVVGLQPVDRALFEAAPRLRHVLRVGTGLDNIDLAAAQTHGVTVENLAGMNAGAVAEFAFALLLAAAKRIPEADASVRSGEWRRMVGRHLGGRTLGLIGFGDIAQAMVPKALGFGMDVVVTRRRDEPIEMKGVRAVPLDTLLSTSHFISVHVPLTEQTRGLIGPREVALMNDVVLVNTARGEVIDEDALGEGLRSGRIAACGLDVFHAEPPTGSPLLSLPNVVLSAHTAAHTDTANEAVAAAVVDGVLNALARH